VGHVAPPLPVTQHLMIRPPTRSTVRCAKWHSSTVCWVLRASKASILLSFFRPADVQEKTGSRSAAWPAAEPSTTTTCFSRLPFQRAVSRLRAKWPGVKHHSAMLCLSSPLSSTPNLTAASVDGTHPIATANPRDGHPRGHAEGGSFGATKNPGSNSAAEGRKPRRRCPCPSVDTAVRSSDPSESA
jgi:hypothetical protein